MKNTNQCGASDGAQKSCDAGAFPPASGSACYVFELCDVDERDDTITTLGVFSTFEAAVAQVEKLGAEVCDDPIERAVVEIHPRKIDAWSRHTSRPLFRRVWVYDYEREHGDRWQEDVTMLSPDAGHFRMPNNEGEPCGGRAKPVGTSPNIGRQ